MDAVHNLYQLSLMAVVSVVIANAFYIVTQPGEVLGFLRRWVYGLVKKHGQNDYTRIERIEYYLKPFLGCPKCMSGQFALWFYLVAEWHTYDGFSHVLVVSLAVLIGYYLSQKLYE